MSCSAILLDGVAKRFGDTVAVRDAHLCVEHGEVVALLGPSGCGKTTLLRLIAGFETPDAGTVQLAGTPVAGGAWVPPERRRVGMVFQDYALFPHLTVAENVGFGLPRGERAAACRCCSRSSTSAASAAATRTSSRAASSSASPSRGRSRPPPTPCCSTSRGRTSIRTCEWSSATRSPRILRPLGVTVVLVTHDREEAFSLADRIALVRDGTVVQEGTPEEIYFAPTSRWAAEFVGAGNVLPGRVEAGLVHTAVGAFPANGASGADAVDVLVRPELLELAPDPAGPGEVVTREFRGHDVFYRVRLDGLELVSHRPSTEVVPLGARVSIRLHEGRVPVLHGSSNSCEPSVRFALLQS